MSFLVRTLVWLGGLALIFGGLAFCLMFGFTFLYFGAAYKAAALMATFVAIPSGVIGLALDARYEFSAGIHKRVWLEQQRSSREHLRNKEISYRQALSKYFNAAYKLTQPPSLLSKLMSGQSDEVNKDELKNQLWIVRYALKIIDSSYRPSDIYDLDAWIVIVDELSEELAKVKETRGSWLSSLKDWMNPKSLARHVVDRWHDRRAKVEMHKTSSLETEATEFQMLSQGNLDELAQMMREGRMNQAGEQLPLERKEQSGNGD